MPQIGIFDTAGVAFSDRALIGFGARAFGEDVPKVGELLVSAVLGNQPRNIEPAGRARISGRTNSSISYRLEKSEQKETANHEKWKNDRTEQNHVD